MMRSTIAWLAAGCVMIGSVSQALADEPAETAGSAGPSMEEIVAGIRQAHSAIKNLSVTGEYEKLMSPALDDPAKRGQPPSSKKFSMKCIAEPGGRAWYETLGDEVGRSANGEATTYAFRTIGTFDGIAARMMTGSPDRWHSGSIDPYLHWYGPDPRQFVTHFLEDSIAGYFADRSGRIVGTEAWEGRRVTVIETDPVNGDGFAKSAFWVDLERNFLVVRSIRYWAPPGDTEYRIRTQWQAKEHAEIAPGIWLPGYAHQQSYFRPDGENWELAWGHEGRLSDWQVNIAVPDEQYVLQFPTDLFVTDRRPGAPPDKEQLQRHLDAQQAAAIAAKLAARAALAEKPPYDTEADAREQIDTALAKAKARDARVLLVFGGNWCHWCVKLHALFVEDETVAVRLRNEYVTVWIDTEQLDKHVDLAERYSAPIAASGVPFLAVLDAQGELLTTQNTGDVEEGPKHDPNKVLAFLDQWKIPQRNAEDLLAGALAESGKQDKPALVALGAPWCGWCHVLQDFLNEHADVFDAHYVRLKIDLDRMDQGPQVAERLRGADATGGIPWFVVLDSQGKPLATADGPQGNIGYPVKDHEIAHFMELLATTAPRMTEAERTRIREDLVEAAKKYE